MDREVTVTMVLRIPRSIKRKIEDAADEKGITPSAYIIHLIEWMEKKGS